MDLFLILTPFLLLAIVALVGFVGCTTFTGVDSGAFFIQTQTLPQATVDVLYSATMAASGGAIPYHWTIIGGELPAGLTMDHGGTISGTPTGAAKTYTVTIQVEDSPTSPDPKKPAPTPNKDNKSFDLTLISTLSAPTVSAINPSSGPIGGGTEITVGGFNFAPNATIALGGVPASDVTLVSSTSITAKTGAHGAGAVDVVVTNADTQSATLPKAFTYAAAVTGVAHSGATDIATPAGVTATTIESAVISLPGAGSKLIIVTVAWGGGGTIVGGAPTFVSGGGGITFQAVAGAAPWNGMQVQTFFANEVPPGPVQVKVQFSVASPSNAKLCTSAYDNAAPGNPTYGLLATPNGQMGTALHSLAPINANPQDLVYAVGFAANSSGVFPGGITITPGAGLTAEPGPGNPLVEDQQITAAGSVTPTATNSGGASSFWFMFAMGIKHA